MASPFTFGKKDPRQQFMEQMNYQPSQTELNEAVNRRVAEQLLRRYEPPKQASLEDLGSGFERGIIPGIAEGAGQIGNYLINNPQGKQISAALLSGTAPAIAQGLYQSGLADQKAYNQQVQQADLMNQRQAQLGQQYLQNLENTERGNLAAGLKQQEAQKKADRETQNQILGQENVLRKEYDRYRRDYEKVKTARGKVESSINRKTAAGDVSAVFAYMKILDPGSVVREGEQATAKNAAGVPDRIKNAYNKARTGETLTDKQRQDFLESANQVFNSEVRGFNDIRNQYRDQSKRQSLNDLNVIGKDEDEIEIETTEQKQNDGNETTTKKEVVRRRYNLETGDFE